MDQELTKNRLQEIDSNQRQGVEPVSITLGGSDPGRGSGSDYRLLGNGLPIGTGDYPTRKRRQEDDTINTF